MPIRQDTVVATPVRCPVELAVPAPRNAAAIPRLGEARASGVAGVAQMTELDEEPMKAFHSLGAKAAAGLPSSGLEVGAFSRSNVRLAHSI